MARIVASAVRTCFGDGDATFEALLDGRSGAGPLRHIGAESVNVTRAYHPADDGPEPRYGASRLLASVVARALADAGVDAASDRVPVVVGTGLRELRAVERWAEDGAELELHRLHFGPSLAELGEGLGPVITLSNACSASGHALALAQDLVDSGAAERVIAAGTDVLTASMLAMIGRVTPDPTTQVRPFDRNRTGVLLGEGAAAVVVAAGDASRGETRLLATGLCCDAHHETAPDVAGMARSMRDAFTRAGVGADEVDLVVTHGTGTELNDPAELSALRRVFSGPRLPVLTGIKGAVGHTSGAAALVNVDVAIRAMRTGRVPGVAGLREAIGEADGFRFAAPAEPLPVRVAQVNAFGFGGVNAVTLLAAPEVAA